MARIATKDGTYTDEAGVQRRVVKGSLIPAHGMEGFTDFEEVPTSTLGAPVVEETTSSGKGSAKSSAKD